MIVKKFMKKWRKMTNAEKNQECKKLLKLKCEADVIMELRNVIEGFEKGSHTFHSFIVTKSTDEKFLERDVSHWTKARDKRNMYQNWIRLSPTRLVGYNFANSDGSKLKEK